MIGHTIIFEDVAEAPELADNILRSHATEAKQELAKRRIRRLEEEGIVAKGIVEGFQSFAATGRQNFLYRLLGHVEPREMTYGTGKTSRSARGDARYSELKFSLRRSCYGEPECLSYT